MMTNEISAEVVEKMVALVREMCASQVSITDNYREAEAIVALLPKPVDPDLIEARHIANLELAKTTGGIYNYEAGEGDDTAIVRGIYAGIKLGRSLANSASSS